MSINMNNNQEIKTMTAPEAWSAIYEHNLKVEKKIDSIEIITKENQEQLKIFSKESKRLSEEVIRLDERQKLHKQEFDDHRRNQEHDKNKLFHDIRIESEKTVDNRFMEMENKFQKKIIYIMFVVTIAALLTLIKDGFPFIGKLLKMAAGGI